MIIDIILSLSHLSAASVKHIKEEYKKAKFKILINLNNFFTKNSILNEDLNDKVYIFGGLNFNNQDKNIDVWSNVPVAKFTLPRFTLINSKLIVNMYVKDKTSFKLSLIHI